MLDQFLMADNEYCQINYSICLIIELFYQAENEAQLAANACKQDTLPGVLIKKKVKMALTVVE